MSQYITYIVAQGDTLETISQSQLGSDQTDLIIQLNQLRYPYISDNPFDQYSMFKGYLQIRNSLGYGSLTTTLSNNNSLPVNYLDTVFLQDLTTGNYESIVVQSANANSDGTVTITFQTGTQNTYYASSTVALFDNQQNIATKVLQTGDTLYLPVTAPNVYSISQGTSDIYGTDIALDENGFIQRTTNGWATVSGLDNLSQALNMRWKTPLGGLPGDDGTYGNGMWDLLGETNTDYYLQLATSYAQQSARSDPRVSDVTNVSLTSNGDSQVLTATIQPVNSPAGFVVAATLPIGGGS